MVIGKLNIDLLANVARLAKDVQEAKGLLRGFARDADRIAGQVKSALGTLGAGLSVAGFAALTKSAINANDALGDLSKTTRIAATDLAGLRFAAQQSGANLEATASAINKLAINMGKDSEKFRALGVSARDPLEAFKQLADATNAIADPQQRAAVLAEALGKGWERTGALLAEGSTKIGEMVANGREMSGVTEDLVRQSDEFNDKLGELAGNGGAVNGVLREMLPLLNATLDGLIESSKGATVWSSIGGVLTDVLRALIHLGGSVAFVFRGIGTEIGGMAAQIAALLSGDFARFREIGRTMTKDAEAARKAFDEWEKSIAAAGAAARKSAPEIDALDQVSRRAASEAAAAARAFIDGEEAKKRATKEAAEAAKQAAADRMQRGQAEVDAQEEWAKIEQEIWQFYVDKRNKHFADAAKDREFVTKQEVEAAEDFARNYYEAWRLYNEHVREEDRKTQEKLREQAQPQINLWNEIADAASGFFSDLVTNGRDAFANLKRFAKDLLAQMLELFAKRWILQMGASMGGPGAAGLLSQAAGLGQGTMAGGGLDLIGSGLGMAGSFLGNLIGGGAGVAAPGMGLVAGIESALIGSGGFGAAIAGSGIVGMIGAALPWIGIGLAVASLFSKPRGGPKEEGAFLGLFDPDGTVSQIAGQAGRGPGALNIGPRNNASLAHDAAMRDSATTLAGSYFGAARTLGFDPRALQFGFGISTDPRGTASPFLSGLVRDAQGNEIFREFHGDNDLGRSEEEIAAATRQMTARMLLAAVQASELPEALAGIFDMVVAETATEAQVQGVFDLAAAFKELSDTIDTLGRTPLEQLRHSLGQMKDRISDADEAFKEALKAGDPGKIAAAERDLQAAILDRYARELTMIAQLREAIRQVEEQAYQFSLNIASRINAVGGSRDIGAIAMGRAGVLRGRIGGDAPTQFQVEDIESYVGAIDTWYQARRSEIEAQIAAEQQGMQAIAQAQQGAIQARLAGLQQELAVTQQFQSVLARAGQMLDEMRLTALNPMSVHGRLGLATDDAAAAREAYNAASGVERAAAANRLMDALQRRLGLLGEAFQRPSGEFQAGYNEIAAELTALQGDARTEAERALDIQRRMVDLQGQSNAIASMAAASMASADSRLAALDQEALGYYEWAEREGERLFDLHRQNYQDQLMAITGGMEVDLYVAQLQRDSLDQLIAIRTALENPPAPADVTINIVVDGGKPEEVIRVIENNAPRVRRALTSS